MIDNGCLNLDVFEENYALYQKDREAVDASWQSLFDQLDNGTEQSKSQLHLPLEGDWRIHNLIDAYRTYGHLLANTNPIAMQAPLEPKELKLETLGFSENDLSKTFPTYGITKEKTLSLAELINILRETYSNKIGIEYMGMQNPELEKWIQERIEPNRFQPNLSIDQKQMILQYLNKSELLESFLHTKFVGQKRFSIEGAETLIPMLAAVINDGALKNVDEFIIGMAHRGRLNVLSNIFDKSYAEIFSEFQEGYIPASLEGSGDVKYHKGFYSELKTINGHEVKLTLTPNPSHLEAVDGVVEGQARARQVLRNDVEQERVLPILIHGDAALSGQGVVYETMQLCHLDGYSTGGTIHLVVNNQIGFTTLPEDGRSTQYCTDVAHAFGAPVFHVNAEDPDGCIHAVNLAIELRQKFHCDVFIDLNCYRKYGHNEGDEPSFTQPLAYLEIRQKRPIRDLYRDKLIEEGVLEQSRAENLETEFKSALQQALAEQGNGKSNPVDEAVHKKNVTNSRIPNVSKQSLQEVGELICTIPDDLSVHPKLVALMKERQAMLAEARPLDWGMAELLAYGTILWEGISIRLSGQDTCRGTFSHRHALLMDQKNECRYIPLQHLKPLQGRFDVYNSPLSEYAVLGFEFGYSVANPSALVIWEAQFGDFCNTAQVLIDQFIASSEQKWCQRSSLTMLLPHGYEGQGPEHSSARIERFLTLSADNNMRVVNPTTPAQLFHLLRRQALSAVKKPLIAFTPKGLLRHPKCVSSLDDLAQGEFQEFLEEPLNKKEGIETLVFCSGRIFYDLVVEREKRKKEGMAIVRIEQLYPLNLNRLKEIIGNYKGIKRCIWVQEEPNNMGAWSYIQPHLRECLFTQIPLECISRPRSASTAVGSHAIHNKEYEEIMKQLFREGQ